MDKVTLNTDEVIIFEIVVFGHSTKHMHPSVFVRLEKAGYLRKTKTGIIKTTDKAIKMVERLAQ